MGSVGLSLVLLAAAVTLMWRQKDLRSQMGWGGLLAIPVLALPAIFLTHFWLEAFVVKGVIFIISRLVISFSLGALASGVYEAVLHHRFNTTVRSRRQLLWLLAGPILLVLLSLITSWPFVNLLLCALVLDLAIVLIWRPDLTWDALFSALAMALLYLIVYFLAYRGVPGEAIGFWTFKLSGLTVGGVPLEEMLTILLFGALWGPIYVAIKDIHQTD